MTTARDDVFQLIKLEDDGVAAALDKYDPTEIRGALQKLSEPIKLSFNQRMMARAFSINVPAELERFARLLRDSLTKKAPPEVAPTPVIEAGFPV